MKPANLLASKVYTTIQAAAADITFATGQVAFNGCGANVVLNKIVNFTKKIYAAGTLQIATVAFAAMTVTDSTVYSMTLLRKDTNQLVTYTVITGVGATTTTIADQFDIAIKKDLAAFVTSSRAGTTLTLTEKSVDTAGVLITAPTGTAVNVTTPHVDPSGTVAEVKEFDSTVTSGTFRRYDFTVNREIAGPGGQKQISEARIVIWADEGAGSFSAFDDRLVGTANNTGILSGNYLDDTSTETLEDTSKPYVAVA